QDPSEPLGPHWLEETGRDITALGGMTVLALITLSVAGFLVLQGRSHMAGLILATIVSGMLLSYAFKYGFDRPRPDLVPHGSYVYTSSFPSGHSMMSAVVYLTLGALLARVQSNRSVKIYLLTVAVLLTGL